MGRGQREREAGKIQILTGGEARAGSSGHQQGGGGDLIKKQRRALRVLCKDLESRKDWEGTADVQVMGTRAEY